MMKRLLACLLAVACLLMGFALAEGEALDMRVIKCTTRVNIREYPTTNATVVSHAPLGAMLVGCQKCPRAPEWYAVVYEGIAGYIRGDFLEVVGETAVPAVEEAPAKVYTYEEVRAVLAEKSRTGFRAEVKAILTAHGVKQLSDVKDPDEFAAIVAEAEGIGNG